MMMVVKPGIRARPALSKLFKKVHDGTRLKTGRPCSRIHAWNEVILPPESFGGLDRSHETDRELGMPLDIRHPTARILG